MKNGRSEGGQRRGPILLGLFALAALTLLNSGGAALAQGPVNGSGPQSVAQIPLGANCSTSVVYDDQWSNGFRLVCQNNMYVLMVDLTNPAIRIDVAAGTGTRLLSSFADNNTIAMINGDYTSSSCLPGQNCAQGLTISNGSSPSTYTNTWNFCYNALYRRQIGFGQDNHAVIDWGYRFVSDAQLKSLCSQYGFVLPVGGGREAYSYNVVGGGPRFRTGGVFQWSCLFGYAGAVGASNCLNNGWETVINDEHFGTDASYWWQTYQSAAGYSTDGTVLALGESNNLTHSMKDTSDIMNQRLGTLGKTLGEALRLDGGARAGFWYYLHDYDSTPNVYVPNAIRVQRTGAAYVTLQSVWTTDELDQAKTVFNPGAAIRYSASLQNLTGFTQSTYFDWEVNGPCGSIASWKGNEYVDPGNQIWYLPSIVPTDACGGTYNYALSVTSNGQVQTKSTTFTVSAVPGPFGKLSPANGATNQPLKPTLSWQPSAGATSYQVCMDTTNDGVCQSSYGWYDVGSGTSFTLPISLAPYTTYYWEVRAVNSFGTTLAGNGAWFSLTTAGSGPPGAFSKISPANGTSGVATRPTITWQASPGATSYEVCADTSNNNTCNSTYGWYKVGNVTSFTSPIMLPVGTTFYWQVRARNAIGVTSANSGTWWKFITQ